MRKPSSALERWSIQDLKPSSGSSGSVQNHSRHTTTLQHSSFTQTHLHYTTLTHKAAAGCAEDFLRVQEGKMLSISEQLSDIHRNTVELNRQKLRSIIKTVVLCGKQNMALRGHRDELSHLDESSGNPGNFQALLNFRVEAGDKVLANHFANGPRNAT